MAAARGNDQRVADGLLLSFEPLDEQQSGASAGSWEHELQCARIQVGAAVEDEGRATGGRDRLYALIFEVGDEQRVRVLIIFLKFVL